MCSIFSVIVSLVFGLICAACFTGADADPKPHILFVLADDFGWNDIGYHGSEIRTPLLDQLARQGVKLENYYARAKCTPSRASLLSGRYEFHDGLYQETKTHKGPYELPLEFPTVAERLHDQGYATHIIGKWHLGFRHKALTPTHRGFDSFLGFYGGGEDYRTHRDCDTKRGKEHCDLDFRRNDDLDSSKHGHYSTYVFADEAKNIISKHAATESEKPMFLYLSFQATHGPPQAPKEYADMYPHIADHTRKMHAAQATCMDDSIGDVIESLKENGMWNNTILIFASDNGGSLGMGGNNWPLRGWKQSLWDGALKAVAFVHSPLLKRTGQTRHELMDVTDWFPTLVHLAGGSTSDLHLDGFNIWPTINEGEHSIREDIVFYIQTKANPNLHGEKMPHSPFDIRKSAAIRVGKWKLLTGSPGHWGYNRPDEVPEVYETNDEPKNIWLFDLETDPSERNDLSESQPVVLDELLRKLAAFDKNSHKHNDATYRGPKKVL